MPIITDVQECRGLVAISADGRAFVRVRRAHFAKCPLAVGDDVDLEAYLDRVAAVQFADAYEAALTSLDCAARTEREIAAGLRRRGYVPPVIEAVTARLSENGLIDDRRYAERMAELQSRKPVGVYAFRRKLRAKGISEADAEAALETFDDEQQQAACLTAAEKLRRRYEGLPPREARAKLSQALARRGFPWDAIEAALDRLSE